MTDGKPPHFRLSSVLFTKGKNCCVFVFLFAFSKEKSSKVGIYMHKRIGARLLTGARLNRIYHRLPMQIKKSNLPSVPNADQEIPTRG